MTLSRLALPLLLSAAAALGAAPPASAGVTGEPAPVASDLVTPWDVVLLPDGRVLVTERPGRIRVVEGPGTGTVLLSGIPGFTVDRFFGLVPHPDYARNKRLYLYFRTNTGGTLENRIARLRDDGATLAVDRIVFGGIDGDSRGHDGGRMAFGPDGRLYATVGDRHDPERPQDRQSLNGKVLRFEAPGTETALTAPADNPFVSEGGNAAFVWSYGHRHPQGLAFDAAGRLYESEHGRTGENYPGYPATNGGGRDEVNLIERGGNYGWPLVTGPDRREGTIPPIAESGTATWAPGGLATGPENTLYVPTLAGQHLRELTVDGATVTAQVVRYQGTYGRLRAAVATCQGLYFTQDGGAAQLLRVGLDPAPACPRLDTTPSVGPVGTPAPTPAPSPVPAGPGAPSTPLAAAPGSASPPAAAPDRVVVALTRLLTRAASDARSRTARRIAPRVGGLPAGRVTLRLTTTGGRTLARAHADTRSGRLATVRIRIGPKGRAALRARGRRAVVLRAGFLGADGTRRALSRRVTLRG